MFHPRSRGIFIVAHVREIDGYKTFGIDMSHQLADMPQNGRIIGQWKKACSAVSSNPRSHQWQSGMSAKSAMKPMLRGRGLWANRQVSENRELQSYKPSPPKNGSDADPVTYIQCLPRSRKVTGQRSDTMSDDTR